ncbi:hypothetical protein OD91_2680 [Lutibacter sp. Hel_I_33_5]|uniref:hypothetical protein n=1 Tax=Lutibacter sp. Hel_I_33_5 TaxID=1566289 RepID=UPI0011A9E63A|nr:hypothetical protein [Lutibacter sp. Hel_I_33_5]TVZ57359.1 hypothetical protein OD91_2680 [Lutibacter sp. Hel_I_33_5]
MKTNNSSLLKFLYKLLFICALLCSQSSFSQENDTIPVKKESRATILKKIRAAKIAQKRKKDSIKKARLKVRQEARKIRIAEKKARDLDKLKQKRYALLQRKKKLDSLKTLKNNLELERLAKNVKQKIKDENKEVVFTEVKPPPKKIIDPITLKEIIHLKEDPSIEKNSVTESKEEVALNQKKTTSESPNTEVKEKKESIASATKEITKALEKTVLKKKENAKSKIVIKEDINPAQEVVLNKKKILAESSEVAVNNPTNKETEKINSKGSESTIVNAPQKKTIAESTEIVTTTPTKKETEKINSKENESTIINAPQKKTIAESPEIVTTTPTKKETEKINSKENESTIVSAPQKKTVAELPEIVTTTPTKKETEKINSKENESTIVSAPQKKTVAELPEIVTTTPTNKEEKKINSKEGDFTILEDIVNKAEEKKQISESIIPKDTITQSISKTLVAPGKRNFIEEDEDNEFLRSGNLLTKYARKIINLKPGEVVSNVLHIVNIGKKEIRFKTDLIYPGGWTRIDDATKTYTVKANDTLYVPIIISPRKLINGNTEIIVNTFLVGEEDQQLANNFFSLKTKKRISWALSAPNNTNIYFKNGETTKRFDFSVINTGNNNQDLFINFNIPKKDLFLTDTLFNRLKNINTTISLEPRAQKEFSYVANINNLLKRNHKRISLNTYLPNKNKKRKTHSLIINSSEPKFESNFSRKRTKLNFVKLPNELEANPYGYPYLPLTVELNAQNVLDDRSFLALSLRGFKQLNSKANIIYSTQINYSNAFFTNNVFNNMPWYVGYFDEKKSIEVGQVSGNLIGIANAGTGVKASYLFSEKHAAGAFFVNSNGFFDSKNNRTFGGWYRFRPYNGYEITASVGRNINNISNRNITIASLSANAKIFNKHGININTVFSNKEILNTSETRKGFMFGGSYNASFLKKRLKVNTSFRVNDKNFSFSNFERFVANNRVQYKINNNWSSFLSTNYQDLTSYDINNNQLYKQDLVFSNLVFSTKNDSGSYQTGLYYENRNIPNNSLLNRGATFRYSKFNFLNNFLASVFTRVGYARAKDIIDAKDYFNLQVTGLIRYKTWNFNALYSLGSFSSITSQASTNDFLTPQSIRLSLQNQYQFPNRRLVLESNLIYSFNNVFNNHTAGIFPNVYYFTDTGWRFGLSANYTFSSSDFSSVFDNVDQQNNNTFGTSGPIINSNFNLNFSLRKDFGIPIPFAKKVNATKKIVAFLDINGNSIKDANESALENVVVKLNKNEVLTDANGEAIVKNLQKNKYKLETFSLEKLNGWFPNVKDSIFIIDDGITHIPFVRGVKVYGDVILDRQKIAVADKAAIDLSRIKITAIKNTNAYSTLTNKKGRFEFYLPFGDYTVTMDEQILGERFKISRNNIPMKLKNSQDGVYISFYVVEKRRKVIFKDFTKKN